jgi:hypothetical protein
MSDPVLQTLTNSIPPPANNSFNPFSEVADFLLKYIYEKPFDLVNPLLKRGVLMAIHIVLIAMLFSILPDKMLFISYASALWLALLIFILYLTDNLYDNGLT